MNKEKVKIKIVDIEPFDNDTWQGFKIIWSGNIGFGEKCKIIGVQPSGKARDLSEQFNEKYLRAQKM